MTKKAVGYVRGSTDEQQNTLLAQRTQIEHYCGYKQFDLAEVFVDEGESAMELDFIERTAAAAMILRMKELGATEIVITKLDRGFRGAVDLLLTIELLQKQGIAVHLMDIGLDPTTPVGEMVATIMASVGRYECRRRSERQKDAFKAMKATNQRCGNLPYGWDPTPAGRRSKTGRDAEDLVPNPDEQAVLRRIVAGDLAPGVVSDNEAARILNREGVPAKKGGKWSGKAIASVRQHAQLADL